MAAPRAPLSPLWPAALARGLRWRAWSLVVVVAFLVLAAASSSRPVLAAATGNAVLDQVLDAVPATAPAQDRPAVRVLGGAGPDALGSRAVLERLAGVDGLSPPVVAGASFGAELAGPGQTVVSFVEADGRTPARLYGVDDAASRLRPSATGTAAPSHAAGGVWLPVPVAESVDAAPGDEVAVVLETSQRGEVVDVARATVVVAGSYEVGPDGRRPSDPPGQAWWSASAGSLPSDDQGRRSPLVVAEPQVVDDLAAQLGDRLLWTADAELAPAVTTLDEAGAVVDQLSVLRDEVAALAPSVRSGSSGDTAADVRAEVVSGLDDLVARADAVAATATGRTAPAQIGVTVLGLAAVGAVALLTAARRDRELRLGADLGIPPEAVAGLLVVETLPLALVGLVAGVGASTLTVAIAGPEGTVGLDAVAAGAVQATGVTALGLSLLALVTAGAARRAASLARHRRVSRLPWEAVTVVAAVVAVAGLVAQPAGRPAGLDLAVPLLVVASTSAIGTVVLARLLTAWQRRSERETGTRPAPLRPRRAFWVLLGRRLAGPSGAPSMATALVASGLGMVLFVLSGAVAVERSLVDKSAVTAGAATVARVDETWQLDPDLPVRPDPATVRVEITPDGRTVPLQPPPPTRDPRMPDGDTVVWGDDVQLSSGGPRHGLLVVDTATFDGAAAWGHDSGPLQQARALLPTLARHEAEAADAVARGETDVRLPVLVAGNAGLRAGSDVALLTSEQSLPAVVVGVAAAFPGQDDEEVVVVTGSDAYLPRLAQDPRTRPADGDRIPYPVSTSVWSRRSVPEVADHLEQLGMDDVPRPALAEAAARGDFVAARLTTGYQAALAVVIGTLAVVALCLQAVRSATRSRAAGIVLDRAGLGRSGVRRLVDVQSAAVTGAGLVLAAVAVTGLTPLARRLLDPAPSVAPPLTLEPVPLVIVAVTGAAVLAWAGAVAVARVAARSISDDEVLRDAPEQ